MRSFIEGRPRAEVLLPLTESMPTGRLRWEVELPTESSSKCVVELLPLFISIVGRESSRILEKFAL